jgi:ectoine hydroxylase-related dioxygenase (phytanoyl-CoA dioxygenase family)
MAALSQEQQIFFWDNGYLVMPDAVDKVMLAELQRVFDDWVEKSRQHDVNWGETIDGKQRFHLEAGHAKALPRLLRVNAPVEISEAYFDAMADSPMTDYVASLIGPDVKLHHTKINSKQSGGETAVKWHQDFGFTPHSNDSVVTALLMIDEVTEQNGPLEVLPGSHKGPIHGLWHDGIFTGAINAEIAAGCASKAVTCTGSAGSVCLMHTRLLHGSAANQSDAPRTLFIAVYSADDAIPLSPSPMPNRYEGMTVRGQPRGRVRSINFCVDLPQLPETASFFDQQAKHKDSDQP